MSDEQSITDDQKTVAEAVGIANAPLSAADLAIITGLPVDVVLSSGDALLKKGWLVDDALGYGPTELAAGLEVSNARRAQISRQIATEIAVDRPGLAGRLLIQAGEKRDGLDLLTNAALAGGPVNQEKHDLALAALDAAPGAELPADRLGHLHLVAGHYQESMGASESAGESFAAAALLLEGSDRIEALRFCAATADDFQHPQEAERWLAAAEYEAVRQNETGQYSSLLAHHALTLSRIGFPAEADRALEKGRETGGADPAYERLSADHEAKILLDRGYARQAEAAFASLSFQAERDGNTVGAAFFRVYHARALFASGKANEAHELLDAIVEPYGALLFLKQLALTEGAVWFERWDEAVDLAQSLTEIIHTEVPQWENIGRFYLAKALLGRGDVAQAREQLTAAFDACPPGTDGWRWRLRCQGLEMALSNAEGKPWDQTVAENLTDELLVARWFDIAADLMINRARLENDKELARQAAGLASSLGNPTLAIRAAHVADLWSDSQAAEVVQDAQTTLSNLPETAQERWAALPHVAAALAADPPEPNEDDSTLVDELNETLTAIGLAGSGDLLTPAQRHQSGLVRRRPVTRTAGRWLGIAAAVVVIIGVSVGISWALRPEADPTPTTPIAAPTTTTTTTTIPLTIEETLLPPPVERLSGGFIAAGDFARSGATEATGVKEPGGYYWKYTAGDRIGSTPVTYGNLVYFGSQDFDIYAIDQTTKDVFWTLSTGGAVLSTPAVGQIDNSEGAIGQGSTTLLVVGSDDGFVWARAASTPGNQPELWKYEIGEPVRTTPVLSGNLVIVTGADGRVHGIQGADGSGVWVYPAEGSVAPFEMSPALANDYVYAGDSAGVMHVIDAKTGGFVCDFDTGAKITTPASIVDGTVYFGDSNQGVYQMAEGECPTSRGNAGRIQVKADFEVLAYGGLLLMPDGVAIYGYNLPSGESAALNYPVPDGSNISTALIVADGLLYFGDQNGGLHAIDAVTLEGVWTFQTGTLIRSAPAIGDGVVFVASGSDLWAIGAAAP